MDLTVASFDEPARFRPIHHFGAESMHRHWLNTEGLPEYRADEYQPLVERWIEGDRQACRTSGDALPPSRRPDRARRSC